MDHTLKQEIIDHLGSRVNAAGFAPVDRFGNAPPEHHPVMNLENPALWERKHMVNTSKEIMERHLQAINDKDVAAYRGTMHFPFTYQNYNGVALTIEKAETVGVSARMPWEIISSTDPDWHHSELELLEEVARSESSAVFKVGFCRVDASGKSYGSYLAVWIATCMNGRWGVQFRHNLGRIGDCPVVPHP